MGKTILLHPEKRTHEDAKDYYTPTSGFSFDFFNIFTKPKMSKRQKERHEQIIQGY